MERRISLALALGASQDEHATPFRRLALGILVGLIALLVLSVGIARPASAMDGDDDDHAVLRLDDDDDDEGEDDDDDGDSGESGDSDDDGTDGDTGDEVQAQGTNGDTTGGTNGDTNGGTNGDTNGGTNGDTGDTGVSAAGTGDTTTGDDTGTTGTTLGGDTGATTEGTGDDVGDDGTGVSTGGETGTGETTDGVVNGDDVLGLREGADVKPLGEEVLGTRLSRAPQVAGAGESSGGVLPFTGSQLVAMLVAAGGMLGSGTYLLRKKR